VIALGVLLDTFPVRTLLVPSTVILLSRFNWWPSKLSRRTTPARVSAPASVPPWSGTPPRDDLIALASPIDRGRSNRRRDEPGSDHAAVVATSFLTGSCGTAWVFAARSGSGWFLWCREDSHAHLVIPCERPITGSSTPLLALLDHPPERTRSVER
jgi:hypothetical protein